MVGELKGWSFIGNGCFKGENLERGEWYIRFGELRKRFGYIVEDIIFVDCKCGNKKRIRGFI